MKRNDSANFCILYIEPGDDRADLLRTIIGQQKHVVLMLAEQSKLFQRPEEFVALKHIKRQLNISIFFVVARGELVAQFAQRNGFSVYRSMTALNDDLRARTNTRGASTISRSHPTRKLTNDNEDVGAGLAPPLAPHSTPALGNNDTRVAVADQNTLEVAATPDNVVALDSRRVPRRTIPLTPFEGDIVHMPARPHPAEVNRAGVAPTTPPPSSRLVQPVQSVQLSQTAIADTPTRPPVPTGSAGTSMPVMPPVGRLKRKGPGLPAILVALLILAVSAAGLASLLVYYHAPTTSDASTAVIVGHVYFLSSGQVNESTNQGIDDEVQVHLRNLGNPAAGKKYYAWLLSDKSQGETRAILLGALQVKNGAAQLFYGGEASHTNLLAITSRFLVTEEDASVMPMAPSPDYNKWRYYGEFLQVPVQSSGTPMVGMSGLESHYSFLDHLRHLLEADPMLDQNELPGGLNTWFALNTQKVLEWTSSMRESWEQSKDVGFVRRQTVRSLTYLDGLSYVSRDIPPGTPIDLNDRLARIGLLSVNGPNQDPSSYLDSIVFHLNGLMQAGGSTPSLRRNVAAMLTAMNNVRSWLAQVRRDGQQIMQMSDAELLAPSTLALINDMIANASNAYAGEIDPATNQMREGVTWVHDHMQTLATLDIAPYTVHSSPMQMVPSLKVPWVARVAWFWWKGQA